MSRRSDASLKSSNLAGPRQLETQVAELWEAINKSFVTEDCSRSKRSWTGCTVKSQQDAVERQVSERVNSDAAAASQLQQDREHTAQQKLCNPMEDANKLAHLPE